MTIIYINISYIAIIYINVSYINKRLYKKFNNYLLFTGINMKYVILIGDGMSDYPISELKNKTPLEVANKPNIDELTRKGRAGQLNTVPKILNLVLM